MSDIDNLSFVRIVDKQVRDSMQRVEVKMLPYAKKALEDTGIALGRYPVEGYYGKSPELTQYFNSIRTLQLNYSDKVTDSVRKLHDFYCHSAFGLGQAVPTALNPDKVFYPEEKPAVISPVVDSLTIATEHVKRDANKSGDLSVISIKNITDRFDKVAYGSCLVGLGMVADLAEMKVEKRNPYGFSGLNANKDGCKPIATTLTRESTVLSAYVPTLRSMSQYKVSKEVERQGNNVIDAYNALFMDLGFSERIDAVSRENAFSLNKDLPTIDGRCVRILNLELPGEKPKYYHWAISGSEVVDFWKDRVVTTDMYRENRRRASEIPFF